MDSLAHGVKRCPKCGVSKPRTTEFWYRNSQTKDGLYGQCADCCRENNKGYAKRARVRGKLGKMAPCAPPVSATRPTPSTAKVGFKRCPRCRLVKAANLFSPQAAQADGLSSYCLECKAAYTKHWRKNNPEKARHAWRRRRAVQRGAQGKHSWLDVANRYEAQQGRCWWCGVLVGDAYEVDHAIPLARGGTDGPENIVIACRLCNRMKKDKLPHEFIGRLL